MQKKEPPQRLPQGEALEKRAEELGVSQMGAGFESGKNDDAILQTRVLEAERTLREQRNDKDGISVSPTPHWYVNPFLIAGLTVVVLLIVAWATFYFGWSD